MEGNNMKKQIIFAVSIILFFSNAALSQNGENIFEQFTPKFFEVNSYNINVEVLGEGEPIIFLAGGPGDSHDYMQGSFGKYYKSNKVVFIDFLGRGLSDNANKKSEYSIENDVEILEAIRKKLSLNKISIVGHSYGAVHAQAYVIKYSKHVDKMVLINGFHSAEMWQNNCDNYNYNAKTKFPELWEKIESLRALGFVSSDPEFIEVYGSLPTKYIYFHSTKYTHVIPKTKFRGWSNDVYYSIVGDDGDFFVGGTMIEQDFRRDLINLKFPTLIVAGRYDGVSTPKYAMQYKQFMPQAEFVMFENSGHNPFLEEEAKFTELFEKFLGISLTSYPKPDF